MAHAEVVSAFQSAGFEGIRPEGLHDLGILQRHLGSKEELAASTRIARRAEFDMGAIFRKSDTVRIRYHSAKYPLLSRMFQRWMPVVPEPYLPEVPNVPARCVCYSSRHG